MQRVSRCVDERRQRAETDCASYRPYLGQTAESLCLIGKVAAIYWDCLRAEAGGLGRCLGRCGGPARRCALACAGDEKHRAGLGTGMCLLRCWRTTIDPCLGKCLRP